MMCLDSGDNMFQAIWSRPGYSLKNKTTFLRFRLRVGFKDVASDGIRVEFRVGGGIGFDVGLVSVGCKECDWAHVVSAE